MIDINDIPVSNFTDGDTVRMISAAYIQEPAMAPLCDGADELAILEELESHTSTRHNKTVPLPDGVRAEELLSEIHGYGSSYVNAAFCYTKEPGNRFSDISRGAWYASYGENAVETSLAEVRYHLSRELAYTNLFDNKTAYRELRAGFTADFHDLHTFANENFLYLDQDIAYPAGQKLANTLRKELGSPGLLYPSVRHAGGDCLAAFRPHLVQNIRQGDSWLMTWDGEPEPHITRI